MLFAEKAVVNCTDNLEVPRYVINFYLFDGQKEDLRKLLS